MRALVISDTHFGAWTGEDILRQPETIALLEPHLDVDEVIFLGDILPQLPPRRRRTGAPTGGDAASQVLARTVKATDAARTAVEAFDTVVENLGWARDTDKIVFAHTHRPFDDVRAPGGKVRYWNTGSWIYEPTSARAMPTCPTCVTGGPGPRFSSIPQPQPRLLRLREHLNPLHEMS